ncbi:MAG TPA: SGNH/GDSL hydrolase family protein [Blastocatellia bacterium]|nr:SGNH/GDSL hydrolase family protein [Blastocatellia bacterium]
MVIHRLSRIALSAFLIPLVLAHSSAGQQRTQQPPPRRNIGLFFDKLRAGKAVSVAYLGGSITAGAGASDPARTSYRALVTGWLREQYPQAAITEVNAAVGGTGSAYGAMRVRRDVIAQKPDLVFIEFAVNDWNETEKTVRESLEGIIRQLLLHPQPPEIVLIYATRANREARVEWHEAVAEYYSLPSINLEPSTSRLIEKEELSPEAFWKDGVHPVDLGHKHYADVIIRFLEAQSKMKPSLLPRSLPMFLEQDALTYGEIRPFAEFISGPHWKSEAVSNPVLPSKLLSSDKPGAEFETTFEGSAVGIVYRMGPDCGVIECLIDGKPAPAPLGKVDCYHTSHHVATRIITSGLDSGLHKLTVRITGEKNPKSGGHHVRLAHLLVGGQRPERL